MSSSSSPAQRFVCVHGHFYQPPRDNPWLEAVETQDSAAPYHDWNERITFECYAPNGAARMVDRENRILRITNNYARMSYNLGPTLLSWLEEKAPLTYGMVRRADLESQRRFGGHGSAIAQAYNHIILPLATTRDRITQIRWGIADFEHRYGRKPEGMWLAETAVDLESLDLMARHGIRFTVLAPSQCARVRPISPSLAHSEGGATAQPAWQETPDATVDTTRPYLVQTSPGHSIAVFFYDGPTSRAIAFDGLLNSGDALAERLMDGFHPDDRPQLAHVATDGESYGHHHRHGEMALAYALHLIEQSPARLTNYGEFLSLFPPTEQAEIVEDSSWSCFHGVERWRSDCGCNGGHPGWNQQWRAPLRQALDWLRDTLAPLAQQLATTLLRDFDAARNDYIHVILDRSRASVDRFMAQHASQPHTAEERVRVLQLMELERNAQLMYTSCGWFFNDLSGIETLQIITYAARVIDLAGSLFPETRGALEDAFTERLALAKSNDPQAGDGRTLYDERIRPMAVDLEQVAAHYAISCLFPRSPGEANLAESERLFCYSIEHTWETTLPYGLGQLRMGRVRLCSLLTEECAQIAYGVIHFGDQNVSAAVKQVEAEDEPLLKSLAKEVEDAVDASNLPEVVRLMDDYFGESRYSLTSLFRDEQRRIVQNILRPTVAALEATLTDLYTSHASLVHFLNRHNLPMPAALRAAGQFAIQSQLKQALEAEHIDVPAVERLLAQAKQDAVVVDLLTLGYHADQRMRATMERLEAHPTDRERVRQARTLATAMGALPISLDLWQAQNIWYGLWPRLKQESGELCDDFLALGRELNIRVDLVGEAVE
jgi:alpha-amylase/alpha-mannosidase (GH57 family)